MNKTIIGFANKTDKEGNIIAYPASFIKKENEIQLRIFNENNFTDYTFNKAISSNMIIIEVSDLEVDLFRQFFNIIN